VCAEEYSLSIPPVRTLYTVFSSSIHTAGLESQIDNASNLRKLICENLLALMEVDSRVILLYYCTASCDRYSKYCSTVARNSGTWRTSPLQLLPGKFLSETRMDESVAGM
jgi:hypothetical protein